MKSHTCELTASDWLKLMTTPLIPLACFAMLLHVGAFWPWWPKPRPTLDIDRTILIHQIESSRRVRPADLLLLGDSSCLMDVDTARLQSQLGVSCLNLATVSYLDLDHHRLLAESYFQANPQSPKAVLLLLHPESLRRAGADEFVARFFTGYLQNQLKTAPQTSLDFLEGLLGLNAWRDRFLARALPSPLPGRFGERYGFTSQLERHMDAHLGSLVDPTLRIPAGNPEYRIHPALEAKSARFRQALPPHTKLMVGITPLPEGYPHPEYTAEHASILKQWAGWLQADVILQELPSTLSTSEFASVTHLHEQGSKAFTDRLAQILRQYPF